MTGAAATQPGRLFPEELMAHLDPLLDDDHQLVADASFASIWLANYIQSKGNRKFYLPRGLAGLGWGLPMAMGVKVGNPGKKVFCITGDGGFAMSGVSWRPASGRASTWCAWCSTTRCWAISITRSTPNRGAHQRLQN